MVTSVPFDYSNFSWGDFLMIFGFTFSCAFLFALLVGRALDGFVQRLNELRLHLALRRWIK